MQLAKDNKKPAAFVQNNMRRRKPALHAQLGVLLVWANSPVVGLSMGSLSSCNGCSSCGPPSPAAFFASPARRSFTARHSAPQASFAGRDWRTFRAGLIADEQKQHRHLLDDEDEEPQQLGHDAVNNDQNKKDNDAAPTPSRSVAGGDDAPPSSPAVAFGAERAGCA